ncbi:MAG: YihY/virulence factor BrkB family protein [bacterium]
MSRLFMDSIRAFVRDRASIFAASMSFYAIMAIVPFILFLITIMSFVIGEDAELRQFMVSKILESFPQATRSITDEIASLVSYSGIGIVSFFLYAYLSFQFLKSAEFAMNAIFKTPARRAIHHSLLVSFGIITFIILFFVASFSVATVFNPSPLLKPYLPAFEISVITRILIQFLIPFILIWLIMSLLYLILPIKRPPLVVSLKAAFLISILFELAKHAFTWYAGNVSKLGHIYGPLSAFIVFLLWVYYSSCLFLIGAEMITILKEPKEEVYVQSYW